MENQQKSQQDIKNILNSMYSQNDDQQQWEDIKKIAPQTEILLNLFNYEKKIDEQIKKKFYDFQESLMQPQLKPKRILRIQVKTQHQGNDQWVVRLQGKILKHDEIVKRKFSQYFVQISMNLEGQSPVFWQRKQQQEVDALEFRGQGEQNFQTKYLLDQRLQAILGIKYGSKPQIFQTFWEYIKLNKLQDKENKNMIECNKALQELFQQDKIMIDQISFLLQQFLLQQEPIAINIKIDNNKDTDYFYDLIVEQDLPQNTDFGQFFLEDTIDTPLFQKRMKTLNNEILKQNYFFILATKILKQERRKKEGIQSIKHHMIKRENYLNYQQNPSQYIEKLMNEQNRLLQIMKGSPNLKEFYEKSYQSNYILHNDELLEQEVRSYLNQNMIPQ